MGKVGGVGRVGREGGGLFVVGVDGRSENARPARLFAGLLGISHVGKIKEVLKCLPGKAFSRAVRTGGSEGSDESDGREADCL